MSSEEEKRGGGFSCSESLCVDLRTALLGHV